MSTGQSLLDRMEILLPELQLQPGETDVTRGLLAANMAQDYMESVFALHPEIYGDTTGTVTTAANTETTTFPAGLLRIDKLHYLDPNTSRPAGEIDIIRETGGHALTGIWPWNLASTGTGLPRKAYMNGRSIFWMPMPDATYSVRWYGLQQQTDLTAGGTFQYPDICLLPLATFAVQLIRTGLDDATQPYDALAQETFEPVVSALTTFRRDRPTPFSYTYSHDT